MEHRHIALISEHASPLASIGKHADSGGQNVYVAQVAENLARTGRRVDIFTRRDDPQLPRIVRWKKGVRIIHIDAGPARFVRKEDLLPHMAEFTAGMRRFIRNYPRNYDIVHANFWTSGIVAMNLKRIFAIPFVITFHALGAIRKAYQGAADQFPEERIELEKSVADAADGIIAECPQDFEDLTGIYGIDGGKIRIIPCGYDPEEFCPVRKADARRLLGIRAPRVLLQLGRMVPRKGVDNAIRGFARYARQDDGAVLLIAGGEANGRSPEMRRLRNIAEQEGVARRILFAGSQPREKLRFFYSAADLFITTPWYEPFGITPLESMACGTPVLGSRVGGIKHSVLSGHTGWLVPPENPEVLARRMEYSFEHPGLLARFSLNAAERAERFVWSRITAEIAAFYEEILETAQSDEESVPTIYLQSWMQHQLAQAQN